MSSEDTTTPVVDKQEDASAKNSPEVGKKNSFWSKVAKTFELSEWGKKVSELRDIWGWSMLIPLILGFLLATVLVYTGQLPDYIIANKYKESLIDIGQKPSKIEKNILEQEPDWLQPYTHWLEREADYLKQAGTIKGYIICPVISQALTASPKFDWVIKAAPSFQLSGRAFRVTKEGLLEPLKLTKIDFATNRFTATRLRDGDKLLAILTISGEKDAPSGECKDFFQFAIE